MQRSRQVGRNVLYELHIVSPGGEARTLQVERQRLLVGAAAGDLIVKDATMSSRHAELCWRDDVLILTDLDSTNGSWLGKRRVRRAVVHPGRIFVLGKTQFQLLPLRPNARPELDSVPTTIHPTTPWDVQALEVRGGFAPPIAEPPPDVFAPPREQRPVLVCPAVPSSPRAPVRATPAIGPAAIAQASPRAAIIVAEAQDDMRSWCAGAFASEFDLTFASTLAELRDAIGSAPECPVLVGYGLRDASAMQVVEAVGQIVASAPILAFDDGIPPETPLYFRLDARMSAEDMAKVLRSAGTSRRPPARPADLGVQTSAWTHQRMFELCGSIGTVEDVPTVSRRLRDAAAEITGAARAYVYWYNEESATLHSECDEESDTEFVAGEGLLAFVARTRVAVRIESLAKDSRFRPHYDDVLGSGGGSLLAAPLLGTDGGLHAVVAVVRTDSQKPFAAREAALFEVLVRETSTVVARLSALRDARNRLKRPDARAGIFRAEALAAQDRAAAGEPLRISPAWTKFSFWLLLFMLAAGVLALIFGRIGRYSTGRAFVVQKGRTEVVSPSPGVIQTVLVRPGAHVREGDIMAVLSSSTERAEYESAIKEFELQVVHRLIDPADEGTARSIQIVRQNLESARARLEARMIAAPHDGVVSSVAAEPGQQLEIGSSIASVVRSEEGLLELIVFLPGGHRPLLEPGLPLEFEPARFRYAFQSTIVESVSEDLVGPAEARQILGPKLAETMDLKDSAVLVKATLPTETFESDGKEYRYHAGMDGTAEIRLEDETIIELLIPAVKEL